MKLLTSRGRHAQEGLRQGHPGICAAHRLGLVAQRSLLEKHP